MTDMDLRGKDYFTREEAAHYACMSLRQWDGVRRAQGIEPFPWAGKLVYRKEDIKLAMESCRLSALEANRGISAGPGRTATRQRGNWSNTGKALDRSRERSPRKRSDSSETSSPAPASPA